VSGVVSGVGRKCGWVLLLLPLIVWTGRSTASDMSMTEDLIVDAVGRRLNVSAPFRRIISLYGAHTENLFAMGAQEQVIGVSRHEDWPPEACSKPVHSYHDDLERFLAVRPDLVLVRPMIDRGYGHLLERLEANAIAVISLQPNTVEEMFVYWRILGRLTGRRAAAEQMVTDFQDAMACIAERTATIVDKKRVYFEAIHDRMRTFSPDAMAIFVLETAGGINIAADAAPRRGSTIADFGKERILARGDAIDVYLAQVGPMNRPNLESIRKEPGFDLIRAVSNGDIHFIDEQLVSRPTLRMVMGICWIGRILYPEIFAPGRTPSGCLVHHCPTGAHQTE